MTYIDVQFAAGIVPAASGLGDLASGQGPCMVTLKCADEQALRHSGPLEFSPRAPGPWKIQGPCQGDLGGCIAGEGGGTLPTQATQ